MRCICGQYPDVCARYGHAGGYEPGERLDPLNESVEQRHIKHYSNCNCLGDSAECCVPSCPCHQQISGDTGATEGEPQ